MATRPRFREMMMLGAVGLLFAGPTFAASERGVVLSQTVGAVGSQIFTSRQVAAATALEKARPGHKESASRADEEKRRELSNLLLEAAVAAEADSFGLSQISEADADELVRRAERVVGNNPDWKRLEISTEEWRRLARQKLVAQSFIRFKSDSMRSVISEAEAQEYFEKNRVKFGSLPFDSFRENIKNFLSQQQLEDRMRAWFEILRRKHKVREFGDDIEASIKTTPTHAPPPARASQN